MILFSSDKVYVTESKIPGAGRGVFARENIKKGEIIETCPMIEIFRDDLVTYLFFFGKNKKRSALALGFGSLYNHSDKPNTAYKIKPKEKTIEFSAMKDIVKDEEITFNYRGGSKLKLWFED